jgi:succinate dehydrogenase / fumarate reductase cytochrome b subunit
MYLEAQNNKARRKKYAQNNAGGSSSWMSRNMLITGIMVLLFLGLHFYDFWVVEMNYKYVAALPEDPTRYFAEVQHKFVDVWRVAIYVVAFIFLGLHLAHGFQSAFQSVGFRHTKYTPIIKKLGMVYAVLVPLGFIIIAVYHHISIAHS